VYVSSAASAVKFARSQIDPLLKWVKPPQKGQAYSKRCKPLRNVHAYTRLSRDVQPYLNRRRVDIETLIGPPVGEESNPLNSHVVVATTAGALAHTKEVFCVRGRQTIANPLFASVFVSQECH